jgi:F-box/leucine-rich repeat protein 10/11
MECAEYLQYHRDKTNYRHPMNIIDLEFSHCKAMTDVYRPPDMVLSMSLGHMLSSMSGPRRSFTDGNTHYLLLSEDGCQTDWHTDFTGTAVFYVVLMGRKHFFLVQPTPHNILAFKAWECSTNKYG